MPATNPEAVVLTAPAQWADPTPNTPNLERRWQDQLNRIDRQIQRLNHYARQMGDLIIGAEYACNAPDPMVAALYAAMKKKKHLQHYKILEAERLNAQGDWIESDRKRPFAHIQSCYRRANAWKALFKYLLPGTTPPFDEPDNLIH